MKKQQVPQWLVERLVAGELSADQAEDVRQRLAAANESTRIEAVAQSNREILAAHPAKRVADIVKMRARVAPLANRSPLQTVWVPATVAAGGLAVLVTLLGKPQSPGFDAHEPTPVSTGYIGIKGAAEETGSLAIYRKTNAGEERIHASDKIAGGDVLQVRYKRGTARYGVIASIDAVGAVTLHMPETPGDAPALEATGRTASAFELDHSPGFESFFFITSPQPFSTGRAIAALKNEQTPDAKGLGVWSLKLKKVSPQIRAPEPTRE